MAVVSRVATLRIDDTATHAIFLQWVATAAVQDTPAGQSVTVTIVRTAGGTTPPGSPSTLNLHFYRDDGSLIRTIGLDNTTFANQTATFWFTSDGTSTGTPSAGTVEIAIRATRTSAVTYDVETDGTPNTPPTANDTHLDRGWIRGTTESTTTVSNVALGGAKASPAEYDESLFVRTTLGAALYLSRSFTVALSGATPALSASTNSATSGNFDATFANVVDDRFPAALTAVATSLTVPNATLTGLPFTVLTATNDSINVDPRLTASHHFQVDDNVFARSKNVPSREMLSTQTGFLATRFVTARTASGVNGLSLTQTLTPSAPGVAVGPTSTTTATRDSEAGWSELLAWPSSKPGGTWTKTADVTTPDIDADTHLLSPTQTYTMLAPDPNVIGWPYLTVPDELSHASAGDTLTVTLLVTNHATGKRITATDVYCSLVRYNGTHYQFLAANGTSWTNWDAETVLVKHAMINGSGLWSVSFSTTSTWAATDILGVTCSWKVGGTPYQASVPREFVGGSNAHSGYALDPIAFALSNVISQR